VAFLGEPPLTSLLGVLILASIPSAATIAGGVLILAGVALTIIEPAATRRPEAAVALE
jgi:drug/metabolite transporter (DMT)-like permease